MFDKLTYRILHLFLVNLKEITLIRYQKMALKLELTSCKYIFNCILIHTITE